MNLEAKAGSIAGRGRERRPGLPRKRDLRVRLYLALIVLDALAVLSAFEIGVLLRFGAAENRSAIDIAIATLPLFLGNALNSGAYSIAVLRSTRTGILRAFGALLFSFASLLLISYFLRVEQAESRLAIGSAMIGAFVLVAVLRGAFGWLIARQYNGEFTRELVIFDGCTIPTPPGATVLDAETAGLTPNYRDPIMLDRLAGTLRDVDRLIVACHPEAQRSWAMLLKGANVRSELVATEFDEVGAIGVNSVCGRSTLVVATGPLNLRNRAIKRAFDLAIAVPSLLMVAPMFLIVALLIKLDSSGSVFFKQKRVGRGNALFEVYKFRSMREEKADANGNRSASRDDDRITRVGKIIRRTSIDELPQLLNVLFGSMSIVGPRPHALGSLAGQQLFWEVDERYWHRHALKPGITGLAQVRGLRGATLQSDDLSRRLQADLEYVAGWSIWRDCGILLSTFKVIVHRNAY